MAELKRPHKLVGRHIHYGSYGATRSALSTLVAIGQMRMSKAFDEVFFGIAFGGRGFQEIPYFYKQSQWQGQRLDKARAQHASRS
jgi:hypothetical protein